MGLMSRAENIDMAKGKTESLASSGRRDTYAPMLTGMLIGLLAFIADCHIEPTPFNDLRIYFLGEYGLYHPANGILVWSMFAILTLGGGACGAIWIATGRRES